MAHHYEDNDTPRRRKADVKLNEMIEKVMILDEVRLNRLLRLNAEAEVSALRMQLAQAEHQKRAEKLNALVKEIEKEYGISMGEYLVDDETGEFRPNPNAPKKAVEK